MIPVRSYRWLAALLFLVIPAKLAGQTPANNSTGVSPNPPLTWPKVAGAEKYDVLLDQTSSPSKVVAAGLKTESFQVANALESGAKYYWQVKSYDSTGTATAGAVWSFTVSSTPTLPGTGAAAGSTLQNLGFGVALSLQWNILKPNIVNDAAVDANGIVRVNTRSNTNAGFMLEMHYLMHQWKDNKVGTGPFVAVQPGTDQIISTVGAGWMIDWKVEPNSRKGFGLGLGYAARPSAKTLGDEFVDGKPAPLGPNGQPLPIRFETRDKGSILAVLSFTF